jgi:hypothetical protein
MLPFVKAKPLLTVIMESWDKFLLKPQNDGPAIILTNDFELSVEKIISKY